MKILITGGNGNIAKIIRKHMDIDNTYEIYAPSHKDLDVMDYDSVKNYIDDINPYIIIHTAIIGGRRTKDETSDVVYKNLLMFENIIKCSENVRMIINLDSAAIYDRNGDIFCRREDELYTVPKDYYGFSKYLICKRTREYDNIYNFRIFNIFHINEENDRFIKACFLAKKNDAKFIINDDKYFDFMYENDFIKILKYYVNNFDRKKLDKTINICYKKKYKLSEIVKLIENIGIYKKIDVEIINEKSKFNYCGDPTILNSIQEIDLDGLENCLIKYSALLE